MTDNLQENNLPNNNGSDPSASTATTATDNGPVNGPSAGANIANNVVLDIDKLAAQLREISETAIGGGRKQVIGDDGSERTISEPKIYAISSEQDMACAQYLNAIKNNEKGLTPPEGFFLVVEDDNKYGLRHINQPERLTIEQLEKQTITDLLFIVNSENQDSPAVKALTEKLVKAYGEENVTEMLKEATLLSDKLNVKQFLKDAGVAPQEEAPVDSANVTGSEEKNQGSIAKITGKSNGVMNSLGKIRDKLKEAITYEKEIVDKEGNVRVFTEEKTGFKVGVGVLNTSVYLVASLGGHELSVVYSAISSIVSIGYQAAMGGQQQGSGLSLADRAMLAVGGKS